MSVSCEMYTGLTIEVFTDLTSVDWEVIHAFEDKYPKLDKYNHQYPNYEGKLLLISDGMNGDFCRLCWVDKYKDDISFGSGNNIVELPMPGGPDYATKKVLMKEYYEELTGEPFPANKLKYAMWTMWG